MRGVKGSVSLTSIACGAALRACCAARGLEVEAVGRAHATVGAVIAAMIRPLNLTAPWKDTSNWGRGGERGEGGEGGGQG